MRQRKAKRAETTVLEAFRAARRTWQRNPVTRVKPSRKGYSRQQAKRELRSEA